MPQAWVEARSEITSLRNYEFKRQTFHGCVGLTRVRSVNAIQRRQGWSIGLGLGICVRSSVPRVDRSIWTHVRQRKGGGGRENARTQTQYTKRTNTPTGKPNFMYKISICKFGRRWQHPTLYTGYTAHTARSSLLRVGEVDWVECCDFFLSKRQNWDQLPRGCAPLGPAKAGDCRWSACLWV